MESRAIQFDDFSGCCERADLARVNESYQSLASIIYKLGQLLAVYHGWLKPCSNCFRQVQAVEHSLRLRWEWRRRLGRAHEVVTDNATAIRGKILRPGALRRMALQRRECLLGVSCPANWIPFVGIDGDECLVGTRFRRRSPGLISGESTHKKSLRLPGAYAIQLLRKLFRVRGSVESLQD